MVYTEILKVLVERFSTLDYQINLTLMLPNTLTAYYDYYCVEKHTYAIRTYVPARPYRGT